MSVMASRELDEDSAFGHFFEKGIHQPWLDHYLLKYSVRAGYAVWEGKAFLRVGEQVWMRVENENGKTGA